MCSPSGSEEGNDGINAMKQSMKETQDKVNSRQARSIVFLIRYIHSMLRLIAKKQMVHENGLSKEKFFLRLYPVRPLEFDDMARLIAERTTLTEHEVQFALGELQDIIVENIRLGRGVKLDKLGSIHPSLSSKAVDSLKEINLSTVKKLRLIYKPSVRIKKALKEVKMSIDRKYVMYNTDTRGE